MLCLAVLHSMAMPDPKRASPRTRLCADATLLRNSRKSEDPRPSSFGKLRTGESPLTSADPGVGGTFQQLCGGVSRATDADDGN